MNFFPDLSQEKIFRRMCERAVSRFLAPRRRTYVGRCYRVQGDSASFTVRVDYLDDASNVLLSFRRSGYHLCFTDVLSWDAFTRALGSGRLVECGGRV